jgi:hypothetical protein
MVPRSVKHRDFGAQQRRSPPTVADGTVSATDGSAFG